MDILRRITKLEKKYRKEKSVYIIQMGRDFKSWKALDRELKDPKYKKATSIIIDDITLRRERNEIQYEGDHSSIEGTGQESINPDPENIGTN